MLDSGMLRPKKSLLAVFGLTRHTERVAPTHRAESRARTARSRRASIGGHRIVGRRTYFDRDESSRKRSRLCRSCCPTRIVAGSRRASTPSTPRRSPAGPRTGSRSPGAKTARSTPASATRAPPAAIWAARCCFDYHVTLGPREDGYPIRAQSCMPGARRRGLHVDVPVHGQRRRS